MEPLLGLPIALPPPGSRALLVRLHLQLRDAILDGRLKPGLTLPSTRALAGACGVSRNTAIAAYERLLSEGYVTTRPGSGTTVAGSMPARAQQSKGRTHRNRDRRLNAYFRRRTLAIAAEPAPAVQPALTPACRFQVGTPDSHEFPSALWHRLSGRSERRFAAVSPAALDPAGLLALREAIAQHVSYARAVACGPSDLVVTAGAQQAFDLLARVLTNGGRTTVAIENPGYPPLRAAFAAQGARLALVPVDAEGLMIERMPAAADIVCVTPSHQFPLGAAMSARRRSTLLDRCRQRDALVIEDDYDGEFRFTDRPLDALQTQDRSESVFYVGTFSKSLRPDLRLGYIVAPRWARAALVAAKQLADGGCSLVTQATVAALIRDGHLARHVRKMQRLYAGRRRVLVQLLATELGPWLEPLPSVAGLHIAARLNSGRSEEAVIAQAREAGVVVSALRPYYARQPAMPGLVFGYGNIDEEAIAEGIRRLRRVFRGRD